MRYAACLAVLAACAGDDYLDADVVTSLPPGDATGSAMSGSYSLESLTTSCSGSCSGTVAGFPFSACDVGTRLEDDAVITQVDGDLVVDVQGNQFVSRLAGGLFADGTFEVGGRRTQLGGAITVVARSEGTFGATGSLSGITRLRATGEGLDCQISVEIAAARI